MTGADREVRFTAADGWDLGAILSMPDGDDGAVVPGAVLVPASRHERDAWTTTAAALGRIGVASLRIDVRGRGTSRGRVDYASMGPLERHKVRLDVAAAIEAVAGAQGIDSSRIAVVTEHDTSVAALDAAVHDERVVAVALLSVRHAGEHARLLAGAGRSVLGLVSIEDREGLRATVDAYLNGAPGSRLMAFRGLGVGITMASVRQFEDPAAEAIEDVVARWVGERLGERPGAPAREAGTAKGRWS